jgi:hypothetical protein
MILTQPVAIIRSVGGLVFDATFEEKHTSELEVTDNPVETGVVVSDHAYMKPYKLTISAGVSDAQLHPRVGDQFQGASRSKTAYDLLLKLQAAAEPFDVQTGLKLYNNMICTSIRVSQDKETSQVLSFEADFRSVLVVTTQTVKYPRRKSGTTSRQASPAKSKGEQQGEQEDGDKKSSLLKKLSDTLTGGGLLR